MSDNTKIEWADSTINAVNGCSVHSPGCTNCYAMRLAGTRMKHHPSRAGLTQDSKSGPVWTGEVRLSETQMLLPLRWKRPRRIFWNAHGDLFHENVPDEWIDQVFAVCALTPQHTHMILTKRSKRMRAYVTDQRDNPRFLNLPGEGKVWTPFEGGVMKCIWLGVSVEDQARADERIPDLLATPAATRFISAEPLLGPVDLNQVPAAGGGWALHGPLSHYCQRHFPKRDCGCSQQQPSIDWVIVGGESGPGARPMHPDWARSLRDQCTAAGVPFFFKQWGDWFPLEYSDASQIKQPTSLQVLNDELLLARIVCKRVGAKEVRRIDGALVWRFSKKEAGRLLDGREWSELPAP